MTPESRAPHLRVLQRPLTPNTSAKALRYKWGRIVIHIGGVSTTFWQQEGILLQKHRDRIGGVSRHFSKISGQGSMSLSWQMGIQSLIRVFRVLPSPGGVNPGGPISENGDFFVQIPVQFLSWHAPKILPLAAIPDQKPKKTPLISDASGLWVRLCSSVS